MAKAAKKKTVIRRERPMEHFWHESYSSDLSTLFAVSLVIIAARNGFMQESIIEMVAVVATSIVVYVCSRAVFGLLK